MNPHFTMTILSTTRIGAASISRWKYFTPDTKAENAENPDLDVQKYLG